MQRPPAKSRHAGIFTEKDDLEVLPGVTVHVIEKYTAEARLARPPRGVLLLPATLVTNIIWNARVDSTSDYNALERFAEEGYYAYTLDWEGYGRRRKPPNGREVTAERLLRHLGVVVEWIRERRGVPRVDLVGSSLGSALAVGLGGVQSPVQHRHIGRIVLSAHVYAGSSPAARLLLFNPAFEFLLRQSPDGDVDTVGPHYVPIVWTTTKEAQAYC